MASGATYSYNWNTHTLVKHRAMNAPKMYHTVRLFLNSMYVMGGQRSAIGDNRATARCLLKFKLNESVWAACPSAKHPREFYPALCPF